MALVVWAVYFGSLNMSQLTPALPPAPSSHESILPLHSPVIPFFSATLITGNKDKALEYSRILGCELTAQKLELQEAQPTKAQYQAMREGRWVEVAGEIARDKAERAFRQLGKPVMIEDTSLFLEANGGLPGPLVSAYEGNWDLLSQKFPNTGAAAITTIAYCDRVGGAQSRSGVTIGVIASEPRGDNGFGWDRIFAPNQGSNPLTFAEMTSEEKDSHSMRLRACDAVAQQPFAVTRVISVRDLEPHGKMGGAHSDPEISMAKDFSRAMKTPLSKEQLDCAEVIARTWVGERIKELTNRTASEASHELLPAAFDRFYGDRPQGQIPREQLVSIVRDRLIDMMIWNHPYRLEAQIALQRSGFVPSIAPEVEIFERLLVEKRAVTFDDFGCHPAGPTSADAVESTTRIFGAGLWSWTSRSRVTGFTNLGSMPSTVGALSMATSALMGTLSFAPVDSIWGDVGNQLTLVSRAKALINKDPLLNLDFNQYLGISLSNDQIVWHHLVRRAHECLGVTLKPDLGKAVDRARMFIENGISSFRVYDPGATSRLAETVRLLRDEFGDSIVIYAGQVVSPLQAEQVYKAGADSLIVGIGDGEMCSTSTRADVAASNPLVIYKIAKSGVPIPVLADGGVGNKYGVLMACGGAGQLTSKGLAGGTIEQPPFQWLTYSAQDGGAPKLVKPYNGEAGAITKISGGATDYLGRPWNLEGANGFTEFNATSPSMAQRLFERSQGLGKALRFQGVSAITELLRRGQAPEVLMMSDAARSAAGVHHLNVLH